MALCDRDDLVRRLCRTLDVAQRTLARLAGSGYSDPASPGDSVRPEKVISETAVLAYAAHRLSDITEVSVRVKRLAELLVPHARSDAIRAGIAFAPALALDFAQGHACLHRMGLPDFGVEALLRVAIDAQSAQARERPPHRVMEQAWIAELAGVADEALVSRAKRVCAASSLAHAPDLLNGSREDGYAFTHALMYATDFGDRQVKLPRARRQIVDDAEALLIGCIDDEDYDLAGELLLTWPYTRTPWSPAASFAFSVLAQVEDEVGFLPSAGTRLETVGALVGDQRTSYVLSSAYHTVYVMGLLTAATLATGRNPGGPLFARSGTSDVRPDGAEPTPHEPHWRSMMRRVAGGEATYGSFSLSVDIRRATRSRDLARVHTLLQHAVELNVANGPMYSQAIELLLRVQVFFRAAAAAAAAGAEPCDVDRLIGETHRIRSPALATLNG